MDHKQKIYLGLVHHPIVNKRGEIVATSVTNLDIHDIARSCKTFGVVKYFIITPLQAQHELVNRILTHWKGDVASAYNPDRQEALSDVLLKNSVEESLSEIEVREGVRPFLVVTGANFKKYDGESNQLLKKVEIDNRSIFLLFGTGWGLHTSVVEMADFLLAPIAFLPSGYNHLSVRSAVAIYLDRLRRG